MPVEDFNVPDKWEKESQHTLKTIYRDISVAFFFFVIIVIRPAWSRKILGKVLLVWSCLISLARPCLPLWWLSRPRHSIWVCALSERRTMKHM